MKREDCLGMIDMLIIKHNLDTTTDEVVKEWKKQYKKEEYNMMIETRRTKP